MKHLHKFFEMLRNVGIDTVCNWQEGWHGGEMLHYRLSYRGMWIQVIFQTFGEDNGFTMYVEDEYNNMRRSVKMLIEALAVDTEEANQFTVND